MYALILTLVIGTTSQGAGSVAILPGLPDIDICRSAGNAWISGAVYNERRMAVCVRTLPKP